jgi:hypothetical protein
MADNGTILELYRALRVATDKYIYFLLAAAGACIAFAINQTNDAFLSWSQLPLGAAVLCWGLSFYFGCRQVGGTLDLLYKNYQFESMNLARADPEFAASVSKEMEKSSKRAAKHTALQYKFLLAGAALYIVWHAIEMYLRTGA